MVTEQMPRLLKALLQLANYCYPATYDDSGPVLNAACDFHFIFGLVLLQKLSLKTTVLIRYNVYCTMKKTINVTAARRAAHATIKSTERLST